MTFQNVYGIDTIVLTFRHGRACCGLLTKSAFLFCTQGRSVNWFTNNIYDYQQQQIFYAL